MKLFKIKIGSLTRGKKKRDEIYEMIKAQQKKKEHHKEHKEHKWSIKCMLFHLNKNKINVNLFQLLLNTIIGEIMKVWNIIVYLFGFKVYKKNIFIFVLLIFSVDNNF